MNTPSTFFDGIDTHIPTASGGNIYTVDGYVIHEFTASGIFGVTADFKPAKTANYEFFMVGAGGHGEKPGGGGGGGGEVILGSIKLVSGSSYTFVADLNYDTTFAGITAYRGGEGGTPSSPAGQNGLSGGSGTGGSGGGAADSAGTYSGGDSSAANGMINYLFRYGNRGGNSAVDKGAGGGGGAGSAGQNGPSLNVGGDGGNGIANDWLGSTIYYGGGGGGSVSTGGTTAGVGNGGGGNGAIGSANAANGRANSGGGGGGSNTGTRGLGAFGILLIRYKTNV